MAQMLASARAITGRASELSFRLVTSLFGHAGIEWDITRCSDDELARWVEHGVRRARSLPPA